MNTIGSITFEWVGPRYVRSRSLGELQEEETGAFLDVVAERIRTEPYFLWEVDVSQVTGMTPGTRRLVAERLRQLPDRAIGVVGAKFAQTILVKLVLTAVSMLDRTQRNNQVSFFPTSAEAERWLEHYAEHYRPVQKK